MMINDIEKIKGLVREFYQTHRVVISRNHIPMNIHKNEGENNGIMTIFLISIRLSNKPIKVE